MFSLTCCRLHRFSVLSRLVLLYASRPHPLLCYRSSDCPLSELSCCSVLLVRIISPSCPHPLVAASPNPLRAGPVALFLSLLLYPLCSLSLSKHVCILGACGFCFCFYYFRYAASPSKAVHTCEPFCTPWLTKIILYEGGELKNIK